MSLSSELKHTTVHSTQYTVHSTQYTVHSTQYIQYTVHNNFDESSVLQCSMAMGTQIFYTLHVRRSTSSLLAIDCYR